MAGGTDYTPATRRASADDWRPKFLAALAEVGCIVRAAKMAKVRRRRVYIHRDRDPRFAASMARALDRAMDRAEGELYRRAVEGVPRKKFTAKGQPVIDPKTGEQHVENEYSDTLMKSLLAAHRPKYRPVTRTELSGPDGGPIRTNDGFDLSRLTDDELRTLQALHRKAAERPAAAPAAGADAAPGGDRPRAGDPPPG